MLLLIPLLSALSDSEIDRMNDNILWAGWWDNDAEEDNSTFQNTGTATGMNHESNTANCIVGGCIDDPTEEGRVVYSDIDAYNNMTNMTISCWVNMEDVDTGTSGFYIARYTSTEALGTWRFYWNKDTTQFQSIFNLGGPAEIVSCGTTTAKENTYHMITTIFNYTGGVIYIYLNKSFDGSTAITTSTVRNAQDLWVGDGSAGFGWIGRMDECEMYNISLTAEQIEYKYDENLAGRHILGVAPPLDTTPPVINITYPQNNTGISATFINFTVNSTDETSTSITCHLRNESSLLDDDTATSGALFNLTYISGKTTIQQKNYYNITCWDNDATNNNSASEYLNITLDNVIPSITVTLPLNNTNIDKTFSNLTIDALCSDPNGARFNYSMINDIGTVVNSTQNNVAGSAMTLQHTVDLSDIPTGNYNLNFTCVDDHTYTDSRIDDVYKDELLKKLYYTAESRNDISIQFMESNLNLCDFSSYPLPDREVFVYDFSCNKEVTGQNHYKFILRDNYGKLKYLPDSEYKGHFVTDDNFITFDMEKAYYTVKKIGKDYEVMVWTYDTYLEFKNSIGGLNKQTVFLNLSISETNYTSMKHFDFPAPTVTIDSAVYVTVFNVSANLTTGQHLTLKGSGVVKKVTQPQSTEVSGKLIVNQNTLFEGTITSTDDVISFNIPIHDVEFSSGENNISLDVKESGQGAINLTNFIIEGDCDISVHENVINHSHNNETVTFTSSTFANIFNVSLDKTLNSSSVIDFQHRVQNDGVGADTLVCYTESNSTGEQSPSYYSYMQANGDSGNAGMAYASKIKTIGYETWILYCKTNNGNQMINTLTGYIFLLTDTAGNTINSFQNSSTETTSLLAGETLLETTEDFQFRNSTEIEIIATISAQSTSGAHTSAMKFKVNSTTISEEECLGTSETGFINSNDAKTVKFYFECEDDNKGSIDITTYAKVSTGETANILNISLAGYEVTDQPLSILNIPPVVAIISPLEDEALQSVNPIIWATTDDNNFTTNISIRNSTSTVQIATDLGDDVFNVSYNFSVLGNGVFTINVTSTENLTTKRLSGTALRNIEVRLPTITVNLTIPANNSALENANIGFAFITETTGANCSLYIDNTINFINQSIDSVSGTNTFVTVKVSNGTHDWLVRCSNETLTGVSDQFFFSVTEIDSNLMDLRVCPDTVAGALILILIVFISLAFIMMGLASKAGVLGFFGSIMLIITSWYISPCIHIFSYVLALFGAFLTFFFIARSFSTNIN